MTYNEAIEALENGKKVKLPEWQGYWFKEKGEIKVFTRTGEYVSTPYLNDYQERTDWELTDGSRDFGGALTALKAGKSVARKGWNGKGMFLIYVGAKEYQVDIELGKPCQSAFVGLKTADDHFVPWQPSQTDMLAEDWEVLA